MEPTAGQIRSKAGFKGEFHNRNYRTMPVNDEPPLLQPSEDKTQYWDNTYRRPGAQNQKRFAENLRAFLTVLNA